MFLFSSSFVIFKCFVVVGGAPADYYETQCIDGKVVGLLDITKCLYDAISKIESAYEASSGKMGRFSSTMESLEKELRKSGSGRR